MIIANLFQTSKTTKMFAITGHFKSHCLWPCCISTAPVIFTLFYRGFHRNYAVCMLGTCIGVTWEKSGSEIRRKYILSILKAFTDYQVEDLTSPGPHPCERTQIFFL